MSTRQIAEANLKTRLAENPYPGRGLILGLDERGERRPASPSLDAAGSRPSDSEASRGSRPDDKERTR